MRIKVAIAIFLLILSFSCKKDESRYPINLALFDIKKGVIKAYTKSDSIIPNNFTYKSIDEFDFFDRSLLTRIIFKSSNEAVLIYGRADSTKQDSLSFNVNISYVRDSIIFLGSENLLGSNYPIRLPGIGNETFIKFNGILFVILHPYGLDGSVTYENFDLNGVRNRLMQNDTLILFHFALTYQ